MSCSLLPVPEIPVLRESGAPQGREGRQVPMALRVRRVKPARKERRDLRGPLDLEVLREPLVPKERRDLGARVAR